VLRWCQVIHSISAHYREEVAPVNASVWPTEMLCFAQGSFQLAVEIVAARRTLSSIVRSVTVTVNIVEVDVPCITRT